MNNDGQKCTHIILEEGVEEKEKKAETKGGREGVGRCTSQRCSCIIFILAKITGLSSLRNINNISKTA